MPGDFSPKALEGNVLPLSKGGVEVLATCVLLSLIATCWTGLRFYSRRMKKLAIMPEDYLILAALVRNSCSVNSVRPD
jgi:hypothetical protein